MAEPSSHARIGVWIGIATISLSFAAYTSALLMRQGTAGGMALPPILIANTVVLLLSSVTMAAGQRRMAGGRAAAPTFAAAGGGWLLLTLGLGLLFLGGQFVAWRDLVGQGFYLASTPGSAFFYLFTGMHALHLLGGIAALIYLLGRLRQTPSAPPVTAAGATALYWHFMGVLWLYLFVLLAWQF